MKRRGKITSLVLAFAMIVSLFAMTPVNASAAKRKPTLTPKSITIEAGGTFSLKVNNKPKGVRTTYISSNKKVATVSKGLVRTKKAGKATITVTLRKRHYRKKLRCSVKVTAPVTNAYTRGDWVNTLLAAFDVDTSENLDSDTYFYGDTKSDATYGKAAEIAHSLGLLPESDNEGYVDPKQDIPLFEASKAVTREYAAFTLVKALGYTTVGNETLKCSDRSSLKCEAIDSVAVKQKLISLSGNSFNPNGKVSVSAGNDMLTKARKISNSVNVTKKVEKVKYKKSVETDLKIDDYKVDQTSANGETGKVTVDSNKTTRSQKKGDIVILPATDTEPEKAIKLTAKPSSDGNGGLVYSYTTPEPSEVASSIKFAGDGTPGKFVPAEGMTVTYVDDSGSMNPASGTYNKRYGVRIDNTDYSTQKLEVSFPRTKINDEGTTLRGKVSFAIPRMQVIVDASFIPEISFKEFTFSYDTKTVLNATLERKAFEESYNSKEDGKLKLGTLPVYLAGGFYVNLSLIASVEASGKLSIDYTIDQTNGFQYKDGSFRYINDLSKKLDDIKAEGSFKMGVGAEADLTWLGTPSLVGFDIKAGPEADLTAQLHTDVSPELLCVDGSVYAYCEAEISEDSELGKILKKKDFKITYVLYDGDAEHALLPKLHIHIENFHLVNECTYDKGELTGAVVDTSGNPIVNARVNMSKVLYNGNSDVRNQGTDTDGEFTFKKVSAGTYYIEVQATGFAKYSTTVEVYSNQPNNIQTFVMRRRGEDLTPGTISGALKNALDGEGVTGVTYEIRRGWNQTESGTVIQKGTADENYQISIEPGEYTILFKADGYNDQSMNLTVDAGKTYTQDVALSPIQTLPEDGEYRILLSWGKEPEDIDAHLTGDTDDGDRFHIFWNNKEAYSDEDSYLSDLDYDYRHSFGPETITIHRMTGNYHYFVHDYTNRGFYDSNKLSLSGAKVQIYKGETLLRTFSIPRNRVGVSWHVFDMDSTGKITAVNQIGNTSDDDVYATYISNQYELYYDDDDDDYEDDYEDDDYADYSSGRAYSGFVGESKKAS